MTRATGGATLDGERSVAWRDPLLEDDPLDREEDRVTILWFLIWLIANNVGGHEPLIGDPVNAWTATLILAAALDFARPSSFKPGRD